MADVSKQVWKFQEGLLCVLLREIGVPEGEIHWGAKPDRVAVDTDVLVGPSSSNPSLAIMVTHGTGDDAGRMKFWRSLDELFELRLHYPKARIASVLFQSGVPPVTAQAMVKLFDSTLVLANEERLAPLVEAGFDLTKRRLIGSTREDALTRVAKWWKAARGPEREAGLRLKAWLSEGVKSRTPRPPSWARVLKPCEATRVPPTCEHSGLRRAISRIVLLSDTDYASAKSMLRRGVKGDFFHLESIGLSRRTIGGFRISDPDFREVVQRLGTDEVDQLRARARSEMAVIPRLELQLRALRDLPAYVRWLDERWSEVSKGAKLKKLLQRCFDDPAAFGPTVSETPSWHWLFDLIVYLVKEARGSRHGFGFSKLAQALGDAGVIGRGSRLQFSYYAERKRDLKPEVLTECANLLAKLMREEVGQKRLSSLAEGLAETRAAGVMERVMNAQEFEPLYWLVEDECEKVRLGFYLDKAAESFVSDLHAKRPGTTKLAFLGGSSARDCKVAVHCRTAHDGATDKRKELCGRGRTLRARLDGGRIRPQLDGRLALLLDGDWRQEDIDLLVRAGWTRIYAYYEAKDLVADSLGTV